MDIKPDPVGFGPLCSKLMDAAVPQPALLRALKKYFPSITDVAVDPATRLVSFQNIVDVKPAGSSINMTLLDVKGMRLYSLVAELASAKMAYEKSQMSQNPCGEVPLND